MRCPKCKQLMKCRGDTTGGCNCYGSGHCYCNLPDFHLYFYCDTPKCKQKYIKPPCFGDQYSICRWFNDNADKLERLIPND